MEEQVRTDAKNLWEGYAKLSTNDKINVNAPQILLLFPELTEFLLDGESTPLEAIAWLDEYVADRTLNKADFETHYISISDWRHVPRKEGRA